MKERRSATISQVYIGLNVKNKEETYVIDLKLIIPLSPFRMMVSGATKTSAGSGDDLISSQVWRFESCPE